MTIKKRSICSRAWCPCKRVGMSVIGLVLAILIAALLLRLLMVGPIFVAANGLVELIVIVALVALLVKVIRGL